MNRRLAEFIPPRREPESQTGNRTSRGSAHRPAGWAYQDWSGIVYPKRKPRDFHEAAYLSEYFDTIEINTSFYQPLQPKHCQQWIEWVSANPRFLFTAKLWQKFTHETGATAEDERSVRAGFDVLQAAGKLGAVLLQFPFSFHRTVENLAYLKKLLRRFGGYPLVVEVRHASWNDKSFYEMLRELGAGFCNIDQPVIGRSIEPGQQATSLVGYVRLHGRRYDTWFSDDPNTPPAERYNYLYSEKELEPWVERIRSVSGQAETTFVITNNHYQGKGVVNALQLISLLSGSKVKIPEPLRRHYPELDEIGTVNGDPREYRERLAKFVSEQGITFEYSDQIALARGMSEGGKITLLPGQSPAEEFATLAHEVGHEMMHRNERRSTTTKRIRETEAEAVAFVVCSAIGLDMGSAAQDYISLYGGDAKLLGESLEYVQRTATQILKAVGADKSTATPD